MIEWYKPFADLGDDTPRLKAAGPNRAERRAKAKKAKAAQRRGQRAFDRQQREQS